MIIGVNIAAVLRFRPFTPFFYGVHDSDDAEFVDDLRPVQKEIRVFEITGPLFFGVSDMLAESIDVKDFTKVLVIRMRSVPAIDVTALRALRDLVNNAAKKDVKVVFSHVNAQPRSTMERAGFIKEVGAENFQPNIDAALDRAEKIVEQINNSN